MLSYFDRNFRLNDSSALHCRARRSLGRRGHPCRLGCASALAAGRCQTRYTRRQPRLRHRSQSHPCSTDTGRQQGARERRDERNRAVHVAGGHRLLRVQRTVQVPLDRQASPQHEYVDICDCIPCAPPRRGVALFPFIGLLSHYSLHLLRFTCIASSLHSRHRQSSTLNLARRPRSASMAPT